MNRIFFSLAIVFNLLGTPPILASATADKSPAWQPWSDKIFTQAKQENKFILLDLEAVWCHWCHVMDQQTYANPKVIALLDAKFIPVKVDQDSRPDLANRYRDYGWPATIIFSPRGGEVVKRAGYIPPEEMLEVLQTILQDPANAEKKLSAPKIDFAGQGLLGETLRARLEKNYADSWDPAEGGLNLVLKFLDEDTVEYAITRAGKSNATDEQLARQYLNAALKLIDPAWGGVYQYSTHRDWKHPHYEKIMSFQTQNLRAYSQAYNQWKDPAYLHAAKEIARYLQSFLLSPEGAFYTSQDADLIPGQHSDAYFALGDEERRKQGIPRVDKHLYARENGWAIEALAQLYMVTGDPPYLAAARRAAEWVLANRSLAKNKFQIARQLALGGKSPVGGFRHDAADPAGPYLGDSLAMARAFLSLYAATAERRWLRLAQDSGQFIQANFSNKTRAGEAGYVTAVESGSLPAVLQIDENISLARFFNRLFHYSGKPEFKSSALQAMRYLASESVATERLTDPGILLADQELSRDPTHITIIGPKDDPQAAALFSAALRYPANYKRVEWWDRREGSMPNSDVQYPQMQRSAAFVCANKICSSPVYAGDQIAPLVARLQKVTSNP